MPVTLEFLGKQATILLCYYHIPTFIISRLKTIREFKYWWLSTTIIVIHWCLVSRSVNMFKNIWVSMPPNAWLVSIVELKKWIFFIKLKAEKLGSLLWDIQVWTFLNRNRNLAFCKAWFHEAWIRICVESFSCFSS